MPQTIIPTERKNLGQGIVDIDAAATVTTDTAIDWRNAGDVEVLISNGTVGAITATLKSQPDSQGRGGPADTQNDEVISIPAGAIGRFDFHSPDGWVATGGVTSMVLSAFGATIKVLLLKQLR